MQPAHLLMIAATTLILSSTSVFADTKTAFDPLLMRECPQADGTVLYTNKDVAGCKLMTLKELSVVPSLDNMPTYRPTVAAAPHYDIPPYPDRHAMAGGQALAGPGLCADRLHGGTAEKDRAADHR